MKKQKILLIFIIFILIILINVNVFAEIGPDFYNGKIDGQGTDEIFTVGAGILNLVQWIGAGMAVIGTIILAIRYMYSAPEEKAVIKARLVPWIIGGVLIFGAIQIVKFIESIVV